jgi:hypothetical protein
VSLVVHDLSYLSGSSPEPRHSPNLLLSFVVAMFIKIDPELESSPWHNSTNHAF